MPASGDPELLLLVRRACKLIEQLDAIENDPWHLWQCYANPGERCILPACGSEIKALGEALRHGVERKNRL